MYFVGPYYEDSDWIGCTTRWGLCVQASGKKSDSCGKGGACGLAPSARSPIFRDHVYFFKKFEQLYLSRLFCDVCFRAKQTRNSFPLSHNKAQNLFEIVHCDIWGPYRVSTSCGARYFLTLVDDYSRSVWAYLMVEKSETSKLLQGFTALSKISSTKLSKS